MGNTRIVMLEEDEFCLGDSRGIHCECWWDGGPCCDCDAPADLGEI